MPISDLKNRRKDIGFLARKVFGEIQGSFNQAGYYILTSRACLHLTYITICFLL